VLILGAGFLWALVSSHGRVLAYAAPQDTVREVDLAAPREGLPGGWLVAALPVVSLGGLGCWAAYHWDRLPQRLPMHWGIRGADRWVATTPATLLGLLVVAASTCLLLIVLTWMLLHWPRRI
jgi:uncharacterized membrane protein